MKTFTTRPSSPYFSILGIIFVILKITKVIDWSWWIVLLPFYGPPVVVLGFLIICCEVYELVSFFKRYK